MTKKFGLPLLGRLALAAIFAPSLIGTTPAAAEEQIINAHAAFVGEGKIYQTGENRGTFVGAMVGQLFVESEKGPLHAGQIVCPAMMALDLVNGEIAATGRCTITAEDGARIFGVWSCRGMHRVGCNGRMMLTGGTERNTGVSGAGSLTIRPTSALLMKTSSDGTAVDQLGGGVLILRDFKFKAPSK